MNKDLDCRIIQDLLPSYVDGLTSEYTNQVIEEHIKSCESCNQMLQRMQEPEKHMNSTREEVDYMKKVRRKMSSLLAVSLISISVFLLGAFACFMIYNRVVPKNYQQVFSTAEPTWFIAHHNSTDCEIDIFDFEADEFREMLRHSKYYYEGYEGNVIYGDMFTLLVGNDNGTLYEIRITDDYKMYYDGRVYDLRDSKHLWDYLERRVKEEPEWIVYEKATYKYLNGKYWMETEGFKYDAISIDFNLNDRTYILSTGAYSSNLEVGPFSIDENTVTLHGKNTYTFNIIEENVLAFDADNSSPLKAFGDDVLLDTGIRFIKE